MYSIGKGHLVNHRRPSERYIISSFYQAPRTSPIHRFSTPILSFPVPVEQPVTMVKASLNGVVLAESDNTVVVEGNHYFPPDSVNTSVLTQSDTQ